MKRVLEAMGCDRIVFFVGGVLLPRFTKLSDRNTHGTTRVPRKTRILGVASRFTRKNPVIVSCYVHNSVRATGGGGEGLSFMVSGTLYILSTATPTWCGEVLVGNE